MLQIIKVRGIPDNLKDYINEINKASGHLLLMINDVLDVTGMEYGVFKLTSERFDVYAAFKDVLESEEYNAVQKNQSLVVMIDPTIPQMLTGDEKRLKQVIANLVANAVKFTPEKGEIGFNAVKLNEENGKAILQIEVSDNGIGISDEEQSNLFQLFEQIDGGNTRKHGGIGIGLALSKRIVDMMGGKVWVESKPEQGTKFTFTCTFPTEA